MWLKFLLFLLLFSFHHGLERIQRDHSRVINAAVGDTIKLQWKYTVPKDALVLFNCGYRNQALNPTSTRDPPLVTLAYAEKKGEFKNIRQASSALKTNLRATDSLELQYLANVHHDDLSDACVLQIKNIPDEIESASLQCKLTWKVNSKNEYMHGGETKIKLIGKGPCKAGKKSARVRGEIFLGAILFDLLLVALLLSMSLIWSRKKKGYVAPKKPDKKLTKKAKKKRDVEKGESSSKTTKKKSSSKDDKKSKSSKDDDSKKKSSKGNSRDKEKEISPSKSSSERKNKIRSERSKTGSSGKSEIRSERSKTESSKQDDIPTEGSRASTGSGRGRERKGGTSGGSSKRKVRSERSESSKRK